MSPLHPGKGALEGSSGATALVENVADYAIVGLDIRGRVASWNLGAERMTGYAAREVAGAPASQFFSEEDCAAGLPERALAQASSDGRYEGEILHLRKDGSRFWASICINPVHDHERRLVGFVKVARDISERKRAEEERAAERQRLEALDHQLRETTRLVEAISENLPGYIFRWLSRADGTLEATFMSSGIREVSGLDLAEVQRDPRRVYGMLHPADKPAFFASLERSAQQLGPWHHEYRFITATGVQKWLRVAARPHRDGNRGVIWDGVVLDITQQKLADEVVRESEARARAAEARLLAGINSMSDGFTLWDKDARLVLFNDAAVETFGVPREVMVPGITVGELLRYAIESGLVDIGDRDIDDVVRERLAMIGKLPGGFERKFKNGQWCIVREHLIEGGGFVLLHTNVSGLKRAELALRDSEARARTAEARLKAAVASLAERILIWDAERRLVFGDKSLTDQFSPQRPLGPGARFEEFYGNAIDAGVIDIGDLSREEAIRRRVAMIGLMPPGTERQLGDGRWFIVDERVTEDGGFVTLFTDITEQKRVQQELDQSRQQLIEAQRIGRIGHWISDEATGFSKWSAQQFEILGFPPMPEVPFDLILRHIHPDDRTAYLETRARSVATGEPVVADYRWVRPDGSIRWIHNEAAVKHGADGRVTHLFGAVQDITERRRVQEELEAARERAERASLAKSQFLANMSHELRTPMNAILGFSQLLLHEKSEPMSAKQREYVDCIQRGGKALLELIDDVLDLAKIESGNLRVSIEAVDLAGVIAEFGHTLTPLANARDQSFVAVRPAPGAAVVSADRTRLMQVLMNLGSNAVKYNRQGGSIVVGIEPAERGWHRIVVTDDGVGIPADRLDDVFQPFNRLGAEHSAVEGTGIGLSISRHLVELMGGRIGFSSEVGRGSRFWVEFPPAGERRG